MRKPDPILAACVALLAACTTTVDPAADYAATRDDIAAATGVVGARTPDEPQLSAEEVESVLADGLSLEESRTLALRNNRALGAAFLAVGIARADVEQSGLLRNPTLGVSYMWPDGGGRKRIGGDLVQSVSDLWQVKFRRELAEADLRERVLDVVQRAAALAVDVEREFLALVATEESLQLADGEIEIAQEATRLVERKVERGMARSTELAQARSRLAEAQVARSSAAQQLVQGRKRLALLLSLPGDPARLRLVAPSLPEQLEVPTVETLLTLADSRRLDVRAASLAFERADAAVALERQRARPDVAVGLEAEHPEVGTNTPFVGGFNGSIEIPIFDPGQVAIRRAELVREQALAEQAAVRSEAEQEIRAAHAAVAAAVDTLEVLEVRALPAAAESLALSRTALERGHGTALELLQVSAHAAAVQRSRAQARAAVALARLELARACGGMP